jgi:hypothetical protein
MSEETQYHGDASRYAIRNTDYASLAIIVVSYNVRELLRACLEATFASLARALEIDATVWVIDTASADGSAEMVAAEVPQARLVANRGNLGFAGGNNRVLRELGFGVEERGVWSGGAEEQRGGGADSSHITEYALRNTPHAPRPTLHAPRSSSF